MNWKKAFFVTAATLVLFVIIPVYTGTFYAWLQVALFILSLAFAFSGIKWSLVVRAEKWRTVRGAHKSCLRDEYLSQRRRAIMRSKKYLWFIGILGIIFYGLINYAFAKPANLTVVTLIGLVMLAAATLGCIYQYMKCKNLAC